MKTIAIITLALLAASCTETDSDRSGLDTISYMPPEIPDGAETVEFERLGEDQLLSGDVGVGSAKPDDGKPFYWGLEDGEPLTVMWSDLMPEGSEEELEEEYEKFYEMLEQRYMENATTLADADPYAAIPEGSGLDYMPQLGDFKTVEYLDGELVRVPGYVVPFDFDSNQKHHEFLFVPYMGACIHTPPPPPNQIIFVRADPAIQVDDIWTPFWITGTLSTGKTESNLGDAAYALSMSDIEPYASP